MGEVINLNKVRKDKERNEKQRQAEVNRQRHGRTRSDKLKQQIEDARKDNDLDGKKLT